LKVSIEFEKCQGHGRCFDVAPDLFDDDGGYGSVKGDGDVNPDQVEAARSAVRQCPERAVALTD
jgi:ferredoxin